MKEFLPFNNNPEEFYWRTKEEMEVIYSRLLKYPFELKHWLININITLYANAPDNMVAVMDSEGDLQMLYGAASEKGYKKLMEVLDEIGEPL